MYVNFPKIVEMLKTGKIKENQAKFICEKAGYELIYKPLFGDVVLFLNK